jgi:hypothetical protein
MLRNARSLPKMPADPALRYVAPFPAKQLIKAQNRRSIDSSFMSLAPVTYSARGRRSPLLSAQTLPTFTLTLDDAPGIRVRERYEYQYRGLTIGLHVLNANGFAISIAYDFRHNSRWPLLNRRLESASCNAIRGWQRLNLSG